MNEQLFEIVAIIVFLIVSGAIGYWQETVRRARQKEGHEQMVARMEMEAANKPEKTPPAPPLSVIRHEIPDNPALATYMQDLPRAVRNLMDAQRLASKLEVNAKAGLWQNAIARVITLFHPNELLYAMTWNAHCITMNRDTSKLERKESHGVVFFSNMRFFHFKDPANIVQFPLKEIYTVEAHKGYYFDGIAFRTPNLHVQLSFAGAIDRKLFRDMIIHIAASAACPVLSAGVMSSDSSVCECPGCGATVIIHEGFKNKCDFCDRLVGKQDVLIKTAISDIAGEIKKYKELLDKGAISEQEFEEAKSKLLSAL